MSHVYKERLKCVYFLFLLRIKFCTINNSKLRKYNLTFSFSLLKKDFTFNDNYCSQKHLKYVKNLTNEKKVICLTTYTTSTINVNALTMKIKDEKKKCIKIAQNRS